LLISINSKKPKIGRRVFVSESAYVVGDVEVGDDSSIWFNAVVRAEAESIKIGIETSIQDCCVLHTDAGYRVTVGDRVTVGHGAILHGCQIASNCIIGIGARILNGAKVGEWCIIGSGAVVTEGSDIPAFSLALGVPARVTRSITEDDKERITKSAAAYVKLKNIYLNLK
jgi:carbonic anhydrase/acetyltransferase-like protein (isoleucine patch superfamily)